MSGNLADVTHQISLRPASHWQPACTLAQLRHRAMLNAGIRQFFAERGVLEVETPLLGNRTVTDPALHPFETRFRLPGQVKGAELYLQTSPEFAMKRLLAHGSGPIYQIGKAFRNEEHGRHHNPEFTLLEWYRPGYTLSDLMGEVEALFAAILQDVTLVGPPERVTYAEVFTRHIGLHPLDAELTAFAAFADNQGLGESRQLCGEDRTVWLDLLFSHFVQPRLGPGHLTSVYHYPACMPSLARACTHDARWVERVEVFWSGIELGNGFHELTDSQEQRRRFELDQRQRYAAGLPVPDLDDRLLEALRHGLPECAGIAIGLDRLLMIMTGVPSIAETLTFPIDRA